MPCSESTPFWVVEERAWVNAGELAAGDLLLAPDGSTVTVDAVRTYTLAVTVHNVTGRDWFAGRDVHGLERAMYGMGMVPFVGLGARLLGRLGAKAFTSARSLSHADGAFGRLGGLGDSFSAGARLDDATDAFRGARGAGAGDDAARGLSRGSREAPPPRSAGDAPSPQACRAHSFLPATLVLMADGSTKPIDEVEVGDWVLAADPESGESGGREVTAVIVGSGTKELVEISIDGETITATDSHPFWVVEEQAWVAADELEPSDRLLLADGSTIAIDVLREYTVEAVVHNLTVDDLHTYHVVTGNAAVLVHNCTDLADRYPPNRGFLGTPETVTLQPGTRIDRYGTERGRFVSPAGIPFGARALPPESVSLGPFTYEVAKPIDVAAGPTAPWFGQPGLGMQYRLPESVFDLVQGGQLRRVPGGG